MKLRMEQSDSCAETEIFIKCGMVDKNLFRNVVFVGIMLLIVFLLVFIFSYFRDYTTVQKINRMIQEKKDKENSKR
ncbi:MAG: hypothetical protein LUH14_03655 [Clostridiaceae bacterium]|nr:hypothetical protein [Clostridiaceae bacterium]